ADSQEQAVLLCRLRRVSAGFLRSVRDYGADRERAQRALLQKHYRPDDGAAVSEPDGSGESLRHDGEEAARSVSGPESGGEFDFERTDHEQLRSAGAGYGEHS